MDFQIIADSFFSPTCILSVQKTDNRHYGEIRIVTGNQKFIDLLEHPVYEIDGFTPGDERHVFIPRSLYDKYAPKSLSFEDLIFHAAVQKQPISTYIHPTNPEMWLKVHAMPMEYEDDELCYCTYSVEPSEDAGMEPAAADTSSIKADVLKTCIKLHRTEDFRQTMAEVIRDIRLICRAEVCTIMLIDFGSGTCSILAKSIRENSVIKTVTQFVNFYDIANSWLDTIGDSDCIIIKNERDMQYIKEVNYPWWLTLDEAGVDSVVMFPLRFNREVLGFIWATNFETRNVMRIKETLELTTFFLSSQIASYKMLKRLEELSYADMLTGVNNRNAMNNRVTQIVESA